MVVWPRSGSRILDNEVSVNTDQKVQGIYILDDLDVRSRVNVAHRLRRDEDELFAHGFPCCVDLHAESVPSQASKYGFLPSISY